MLLGVLWQQKQVGAKSSVKFCGFHEYFATLFIALDVFFQELTPGRHVRQTYVRAKTVVEEQMPFSCQRVCVCVLSSSIRPYMLA